MADIKGLIEKLNMRFKGEIDLSGDGRAIYADRDIIVRLLSALKEEYKYIRLMDITSVDYEDHYEVVYHLLNDEMELLAVKVRLSKDDNRISSVISVWRAADAQEREIYDLMGIVFEGHGNLKRILTPDDFVGHPLQKSYGLYRESRF